LRTSLLAKGQRRRQSNAQQQNFHPEKIPHPEQRSGNSRLYIEVASFTGSGSSLTWPDVQRNGCPAIAKTSEIA
jgi:hypothetical protein